MFNFDSRKSGIRIWFSLLILMLLSQLSFVIATPSFVTTESELKVAIYNENVIELSSSIFLSNPIMIHDVFSLSIFGNGYYINGQKNTSCFNISNSTVLFRQLDIINGATTSWVVGGGVYIRDSTVNMTDCRIYESSAAAGAALYLDEAAEVVLTNCHIFNNTALSNGGGIAIHGNGTSLSMNNCRISDNSAVGDGGGLYAGDKSLITVTRSHIYNNQALNGGGISIITASRVVFAYCEFNNNRASENGGGMFLLTAAKFQSCQIDSNVASAKGGGVYITGDVAFTIVEFGMSEFSYNAASIGGGGLYIHNGFVSHVSSIITENRVDSPSFEVSTNFTHDEFIDDKLDYESCFSFGGCIYSSNYPKKYSNNEFCKFIVSEDGTLVFKYFLTENNHDALSISSNSNIDEYSGLIHAGKEVDVSERDVLFWSSDSRTTLQGFEICYNVGAYGGGVYIEGGELSMLDSIISSNSATRAGGGLYISGGTNLFENVDISHNNVSSFTSLSSVPLAFEQGIEVHFTGGTFDAVDLTIVDLSATSISGVSSQTASCISSCGVGQFGKCTAALESASNCNVNCDCRNCSAGTASSLRGSTSIEDCESCISGTVSHAGSSSCHSCPPGRYSGSGDELCIACPSGKYERNSVSCADCADFTTSYAGSANESQCNLAIEGYYIRDDEEISVHACAPDTYCYGGEYLPAPMQGFWSDRDSAIKDLNFPYRCLRNTCKGVKKKHFDSQNDSCWTKSGLEDDVNCQSDELQCVEGNRGPLCGSCSQYYRYSSYTIKCEPCSSYLAYYMFFVLPLFVGFSVIFVIFIRHGDNWFHVTNFLKWLISMMNKTLRNGSFKIVFSTYQIIHSVTYSMEMEYPRPFSDMMQMLAFINFNFPVLDCGGFSFYDKVYLLSSLPLLFILCSVFIGFIRLHRIKIKVKKTAQKKACDDVKEQHSWGILFLSYVVLPSVTSLQLKALDCYELKSGESFVRSDTHLDCRSHQHKTFTVVDSVLICCYLSIPFVWMIILYSKRTSLFPIGIYDDHIIVESRTVGRNLLFIKFLFECYRPQLAYWETFEMLRRILFVSFIPLMASSPLRRSEIGLAFSLMSLIVYREIMPFRNPSTNVLASIAQIAILLIYAASHIIIVESYFHGSKMFFGVMLATINASVLIVACVAAYYKIRRDRVRKAKTKQSLVGVVERATSFNKLKFETTFSEINKSIPATHCAVMFYSTLADIQHILVRGIAAEDISEEGIVFTLHTPHQLIPEEKQVFQNTEAFVVCSLPRRMLQPVPQSYFKHLESTDEFNSYSFDDDNDNYDDNRDETPEENKLSQSFRKSFGTRHPDIAQVKSDAQCSNEYDRKVLKNRSALWMLPRRVLSAMRGSKYDEVTDALLWQKGLLLLPPQCIKCAFQIEDSAAHNENLMNGIDSFIQQNTQIWKHIHNFIPGTKIAPTHVNFAIPMKKANSVLKRVTVESLHVSQQLQLSYPSIEQYLNKMDTIRMHCQEHNQVPVYHYTHAEIAPLVINSGFLMNSNIFEDSGVSFSTYSPASYNLGSPKYEKNIILDLVGKQHFTDYRKQHKFDVCLVYGVDPMIIERKHDENEKESSITVPKSYFDDFAIPHSDGRYFLRPDRILEAFVFDSLVHASVAPFEEVKERLSLEAMKDQDNMSLIREQENAKLKNELLIKSSVNVIDPRIKIEWACTYNAKKFESTIKAVEEAYVPRTHCLAFYYASLVEIDKFLRSGIPVKIDPRNKNGSITAPQKNTTFNHIIYQSSSPQLAPHHHHHHHHQAHHHHFSSNMKRPIGHHSPNNRTSTNKVQGIIFTLHQPADLTIKEKQIFGKYEGFVACSLPRKYLFPYEKENFLDDEKSALYILPSDILRAMRGTHFGDVVDARPWYDGKLLLPPHCIKRAYQIDEKDGNDEMETMAADLNQGNDVHEVVDEPIVQYNLEGTEVAMKTEIETFSPINYSERISDIRRVCSDHGLLPLFHYTTLTEAIAILSQGFKLNPTEHGDAQDLFFSTLGPANFILEQSMKSVIKDCFGKSADRSHNHLHYLQNNQKKNHKLDICLIYGIDPLIVVQSHLPHHSKESTNQHHHHSYSISKEVFQDFSLRHDDGNYYLRVDRMFGAFHLPEDIGIDLTSPPSANSNSNHSGKISFAWSEENVFDEDEDEDEDSDSESAGSMIRRQHVKLVMKEPEQGKEEKFNIEENDYDQVEEEKEGIIEDDEGKTNEAVKLDAVSALLKKKEFLLRRPHRKTLPALSHIVSSLVTKEKKKLPNDANEKASFNSKPSPSPLKHSSVVPFDSINEKQSSPPMQSPTKTALSRYAIKSFVSSVAGAMTPPSTPPSTTSPSSQSPATSPKESKSFLSFRSTNSKKYELTSLPNSNKSDEVSQQQGTPELHVAHTYRKFPSRTLIVPTENDKLAFEVELDKETHKVLDQFRLEKDRNELLVRSMLSVVNSRVKVEWACGFTAKKFETTFNAVETSSVPATHCLAFHYASLNEINQYVRCGIKVNKADQGILFTLHEPSELTQEEINIMTNREAFVACSLPKRLLYPYDKLKSDTGDASQLFLLPNRILRAMRGSYFGTVVDPRPWFDGESLLSPHCIKRAYQLTPTELIPKQQHSVSSPNSIRSTESSNSFSMTAAGSFASESSMKEDEMRVSFEGTADGKPAVTLWEIASCSEYLDKIYQVRRQCDLYGLIPLYHFTTTEAAPLIIQGGFKMSTSGQGDGGVYFSTHGPASYELGTDQYEENIIIDCFGKERLEEYLGQGKLDVCMVYGVDPLIVEQAPGGRDNAMIVPKSFFEAFSLPHKDGSYLLRPDMLFGAYLLKPSNMIKIERSEEEAMLLLKELKKDLHNQKLFYHYHTEKQRNELLVRSMTSNIDFSIKIEKSINYSKSKFQNIFKIMKSSSIPPTHLLLFHYGSLRQIEKYVKVGIPIDKNDTYNGIVFTTHLPFDLTYEEKIFFEIQEAFIACCIPKKILIQFLSHTFIEDHLNQPIQTHSEMFVLPEKVLRAMRGTHFGDVVDPRPWFEGVLLLSPHVFKRAYQIVSDDALKFNSAFHISSKNCRMDHYLSHEHMEMMASFDNFIQVENCSRYLNQMKRIRKYCHDIGLVPLFHYTNSEAAPLIIRNGFKMSIQGQGDGGGVYFSTKGPCSNGFGTDQYEENIIIDCFGKERLEEYLGQGKLDVCMVYGVDPLIIDQSQDGHENVQIISKTYFQDFSLPHEDGNFYLRPDRLVGAFKIDPSKLFSDMTNDVVGQMLVEELQNEQNTLRSLN